MRYFLIIPASGEGRRFGSRTPKQFIKLKPDGHEVLYYTLRKFESIKYISSIAISTSPDFTNKVKRIVNKGGFRKVNSIVRGGETRQQSVLNALNILECKTNDIIVIHDAVRPFISVSKIKQLCELAKDFDCMIPGLKINDTIKKVNETDFVSETIPRENIWRVQTPQFFKYDKLVKAFEFAKKNNLTGTDEASLCEAAGIKVKIVEGEVSNIKITTKEDLRVIDFNKLLTK